MNRSSNESRPVVGKLFVGGLSSETTEDELRAAFAGFGDIFKLQIVRQRNGQSKRYGFVTFADVACAQAAMADKNHSVFMGERITVERHGGKFIKGASRDSQKCKIYVDGFHTNTTDAHLLAVFSTVGEVRDIEISAKRRLPGSQFAVIQFATEAAQKQAVRELNEHVINGDTLFVRPHVSNERRGSTANSEDPPASQSRPPDDIVPYSRRRKLFLGNMPASISKKEIEELVAKRCPDVTVTSVEYRNANRERKITFGFVELADFHQAECTLNALRDLSWKGRRIHPEFQLGKKHDRNPDPYRLADVPKDMRLAKIGGGFCLERIQRTLHVSPIPTGVTETQIRRKFESYGAVDRVKNVVDGGYAYVEFTHIETAVEARDATGNTKWDKDQTSFIEVLLSRPSSKDMDRCAIDDPALAAVVAHVTGMRCPKAVPRDIHWSHYMPGEGSQQPKSRWVDSGTSAPPRPLPPHPHPHQRARHDDPGKRVLLLARGFPWDIRLEEIQSIIDHEGRIPTVDVRWISSQEQPPAVAAEYHCFEDAEWSLSRLKGLKISKDLARMHVRFLANDHEDIRAFDTTLLKSKLPGGVLMIRNLPESVSNEHLRGRFSLYGQVRRVKTCVDARSFRGRRMGFGFIEMVNSTEAAVALEVLSGTNWEDRQIQVEFAKKQDKAFEDGKNVSFPADVSDAAPPAVTRELEQMSVSRREPGLAPGPGREARGIGAPSSRPPAIERDLAPGASMPFREELVVDSRQFNSFFSTIPAAAAAAVTDANRPSNGLCARTFSDQHKNDLYEQYEVVRGGRPTYGF